MANPKKFGPKYIGGYPDKNGNLNDFKGKFTGWRIVGTAHQYRMPSILDYLTDKAFAVILNKGVGKFKTRVAVGLSYGTGMILRGIEVNLPHDEVAQVAHTFAEDILAGDVQEAQDFADSVESAGEEDDDSRENPGHPPRRGKGGKLIYTLPKPSLESLFPPTGMQAERIRAIKMGTALDEEPRRRAGGGMSLHATHPSFRKNPRRRKVSAEVLNQAVEHADRLWEAFGANAVRKAKEKQEDDAFMSSRYPEQHWPLVIELLRDRTGIRENPGTNDSEYGWIITKDHLHEKWGTQFPGDDSAVGTAGPRNLPDAMLAELRAGKGRLFKMYDDDGELYYTGRFLGDYTGEEAFGPLDDFGRPNDGAVRIDYRQDNGKWETL